MKTLLTYTLGLVAIIASSFPSLAASVDTGIFELNRGNYHQAIEHFQTLAEHGDSAAQYQLAIVYQKGYGVRKDINKTIELLEKSAAQDDLDALFALAVLYTDGEGVEKDLEKAFKLTEKAADKQLPRAQYNLGVMYHQGQGVLRNKKKAVHWYTQAAEQNYILAQFNLALMYYEGEGVRKDVERSYLWNLIAATNGYKPAHRSKQLDERELTVKQMQKVQVQAETKLKSIRHKVEKRNRALALAAKLKDYQG